MVGFPDEGVAQVGPASRIYPPGRLFFVPAPASWVLLRSAPGDTLIDAYYLTGWEYHQSEALRDAAQLPAIFHSTAGSPDSLGLEGRFIVHLVPGRPDTLDLRISLAHSPGLQWPTPAIGIDTGMLPGPQ